MASNKKYWKSEAELNPNDSIVEALRQNEFVEEIPVDEFLGNKENLSSTNTNRRDFLKYVGFSTAAASLAACEGPVRKSIPYVVQPERIIPGVANYYATTIANGFDFASVLVKTREGRPIKIENNTDAKVNGGANARVQGSVLSLYDSTRLQGPMKAGEPVEWTALDTEVKAKLNTLKASGKQIALLTQTYASPSTAKLIAEFKEMYGAVNHVVYDAISEDAALTAFEARYGDRALADYDFEKAEVIVSFGADFLADWQGGGYDSGYSKGRIPKNGKMSKHVQFEANMSLSGANADKRVPLTPMQQKIALAKLYAKLNGSSVGGEIPEYAQQAIDGVVGEINKNKSAAVVVTGLQDVDAQAVVLAINEMLGSKAFDAKAPKYVRQGSVKNLNALVADMKAGRVGALIMDGVNPMYTLPNAVDFEEGLAKVDLSVTFSGNWNETTELTDYAAAANHYLESWGDTEIKKGHFGLIQPTIKELFDTRQFQSALLKWMDSDKSYYDYIKETWSTDVLAGNDWNKALHDGVYVSAGSNAVGEIVEAVASAVGLDGADTSGMDVSSAVKRLSNAVSGGGLELTLYSKVGMGDGQQAGNPWLQEFPDPISRVSWDNYVTVSKADATRLELINEHAANGGLDGSYAKLTVNGVALDQVPVLIQPGQAPGSIGLALGYGRKVGMKSEMQTGVNAYPLYQGFNNVQSVTIEKAAGMHEFACIQLHNTLMGRGDIIKETTLEIFNTKDHAEWNKVPMVSLNHQEVEATTVDLWDSFDRSIGHHFNMSIDLNACTGCGACVVACSAENNVPVVGKEEVRRSRDMHWLRIDRYYSSEDSFEGDNTKKDEFSGLSGEKGSLGGFGELEHPAINPQVAFQPVMCQHCNHAPCETVCPVAATSHGRQGQNQMAYNRCVGTRYCANNCPYKVRRFNWFLYNNNDEFDFHMNNDLGKMVINPDVTVRSRGVIEKCSMCIQKTQKTILDAKRDGRVIKDGEFQTACSMACNNGAIIFGDVNDKESKVAELKESDRMYHLLEHVGTKPNVFYHVKVRNNNEA
ncbi:TAT-variant-translocated molybdopterin oxidoreductase [Maribacter polysiphoniae]|uniref:Molybdopterin-containing oxidoreductase family iron-sulfur binding subunit n=1 Tax=Maribacter polysiphoniae TaxID=429344 RepID=A0A316DZA6_9FLAO|nr:TAT-variant-translocated molybdopterin oxidoreductase [Maribacter polysiphoniae]MBD1259606.1 TAT-variant-translocated molybdopterin oxidoreductase [Maribacter polysiphoniae]PWK23255.1 molybdopterin-containing oxidoreductase family iron-sulfur binding subunit [Maribacter polysiphoniae]